VYITKAKTKTNLLQVEQNFATLLDLVKSEDSTIANFLFSFKISKFQAINKNAFSVLVTLKKPSAIFEPKIIVSSKDNNIDLLNSKKIINNILSHKSKILNISKQKKDLVIASKVGDIFSKINNQIITAAKSRQSFSNLGLEKTKLFVRSVESTLSQGNNLLPALRTFSAQTQTFNDVEIQQKNLRLSLLKSNGISPSNISDFSNKSISAYDSFSGTSKVKNDDFNNDLNLLLNYHSRDSNDENLPLYEVSVGNFFDDIAQVDVPISIYDFFANAETNVTVSFELLSTPIDKGSTQTEVLEKVEKTINLLDYYQKIRISKKPDIGFSINDTRISIHVKKDRTNNNSDISNSLNRINVYKKDINQGANLNSNYSLIQSLDFSNSSINEFLISIPNEQNNSIYRVNLEGQSEFKDFVTKNKFTKVFRKLAIVPYINQNKICLKIYDTNNCLFDVAFFKVMYRNSSIKEKKFNVGQIFPCSSNSSFFESIIDTTGLIPYHIYEVTIHLILKSGIEVSSNSSSFIEFYPFVGGLSIMPFDINTSINDVTFTLNASLLQDQIGILKQLLQQTSAKYDEEALLSRNAQYDKFVAFNVIRYNLNSGDIDDLGIFPNSSLFSDAQASRKMSAPNVFQGNTYNYVIYPLIRNPYDVINEKVQIKNEDSRKVYTLNPRKHLHPLTLTRGFSISKDFLSFSTNQDMLYGKLGTSFTLNAFIPRALPKIENLKMMFFDRNKIMLRWTITGDQSLFDHILIFKEVNGIKIPIGKSHTFDSTLTFIYECNTNDLGNIRFILSPIYSDYSSGGDITTEYILINSL